jgi:hypothetical protein
MLQRLIDSGASMDNQDFSGQTAFAWAASSDATDCGAFALLCNLPGFSSAHRARSTKVTE